MFGKVSLNVPFGTHFIAKIDLDVLPKSKKERLCNSEPAPILASKITDAVMSVSRANDCDATPKRVTATKTQDVLLLDK